MKLQPIKTHKSFGGRTQFWEHTSDLTKTKMKFSTFIPEESPKGCLIWLSGLTCTEENFITKAGAQKYLNENKLMVICPDTSPRGLKLPAEHDAYDFGSGASFYVDATTDGYRENYRMESYITEELHGLIHDQFAISAKAIAVSGHSMGGHGALTLGLRHPQKFNTVSAFSPIVNPSIVPWGLKAFRGYFGDSPEVWKQHDAVELLAASKTHPKEILVDQGLNDEFYETQLKTGNLEAPAKKSGQALTVNLHVGYDHSYYFISTFIESHIRYHSAAL